MSKFIKIHGGDLNLEAVQEIIAWAKHQAWKKQVWKPRDALVSKNSTSEYVGQKFDSEKITLVKDGWTHDHCEICSWTLSESDDPDIGIGYTTDVTTWLCTECYSQFIKKKV